MPKSRLNRSMRPILDLVVISAASDGGLTGAISIQHQSESVLKRFVWSAKLFLLNLRVEVL
jgi:hypothetical protein